MSDKEKAYDYVMVGFGDNPKAAMDDALSRLDKPLSDATTYSGYRIGEATKVEGDLFKIEIHYDIQRDPTPPVQRSRVKKKSGSYGPGDVFAVTRDLESRV